MMSVVWLFNKLHIIFFDCFKNSGNEYVIFKFGKLQFFWRA